MREDIKNSIVSPVDRFEKSKVEPKVVKFNRHGVDAEGLKDNEVYGTVLDYGVQRIYRIRVKNNFIYNPNLNSGKISDYKLREVNQVCFNKYIKFLGSNMESFLKQAQRELI